MTNHSNFYEKLSRFSDFRKVSDGTLYRPAPSDWYVIAGDIRNSTGAIENGKYKEVNMAGATIIAAVSNLYKDIGYLPYAFGGDGAILLVPNLRIGEVKKALLFCRKAILDSFELDMRVGIVPIQEIRDAGHDVKVAKFELSPEMSQAVFWGSGLSYAESLIKEKEVLEDDVNNEEYTANLEGLECRWQEIPPNEDEITSYIILAREKSDEVKSEVYSACLEKVEDVYGSINERNPVTEKKLKMTKSWKKMQTEWKIRTWKPTIKRQLGYAAKLIYEALGGEIVMRNNITARGVKWGNYKSDFVTHVDFRKFDEGLRFVASGRTSERAEMEVFLEEKFKSGDLFYGVHSSESLIVTCYITNHEKEHIHFVDGIDGGYALAAKKMKKQMKETV